MDSDNSGKLISMLLVGIVIGVAVGQQFAADPRTGCDPPANVQADGTFENPFIGLTPEIVDQILAQGGRLYFSDPHTYRNFVGIMLGRQEVSPTVLELASSTFSEATPDGIWKMSIPSGDSMPPTNECDLIPTYTDAERTRPTTSVNDTVRGLGEVVELPLGRCRSMAREARSGPVGTSGNFTVESTETVAAPTP